MESVTRTALRRAIEAAACCVALKTAWGVTGKVMEKTTGRATWGATVETTQETPEGTSRSMNQPPQILMVRPTRLLTALYPLAKPACTPDNGEILCGREVVLIQ